MFTFKKAEELAKTWVRLATDDSCEISQVDNKPYGWIFHYRSKNYDPDDVYAHTLVNAPIIVDRVDGEISGTGTAHPLEYYIKKYEESLPEARLLMTPERHGGAKKYK